LYILFSVKAMVIHHFYQQMSKKRHIIACAQKSHGAHTMALK